jgi:hypothetical protein
MVSQSGIIILLYVSTSSWRPSSAIFTFTKSTQKGVKYSLVGSQFKSLHCIKGLDSFLHLVDSCIPENFITKSVSLK